MIKDRFPREKSENEIIKTIQNEVTENLFFDIKNYVPFILFCVLLPLFQYWRGEMKWNKKKKKKKKTAKFLKKGGGPDMSSSIHTKD